MNSNSPINSIYTNSSQMNARSTLFLNNEHQHLLKSKLVMSYRLSQKMNSSSQNMNISSTFKSG